MTAPTAVTAPLLKPASPFEWALAAVLWPLALAAPVGLVVLAWPAMTGWFAPLVFCLALALGFIISAFFLWLFAPLAFLAALLAAGISAAARGLYRVCTR